MKVIFRNFIWPPVLSPGEPLDLPNCLPGFLRKARARFRWTGSHPHPHSWLSTCIIPKGFRIGSVTDFGGFWMRNGTYHFGGFGWETGPTTLVDLDEKRDLPLWWIWMRNGTYHFGEFWMRNGTYHFSGFGWGMGPTTLVYLDEE